MPRSRTKILLVEDDARIREEVVDALHAQDYSVEVSVTLADARAAAQAQVDLILLDLGLPDGDGLDLCRGLRRSGRGVPIIILTARDTPEQRVRGLDVGADDYVVKPFHLPELMARVRTILRRAGRAVGTGVVRVGTLWAEPETHEAGVGEESLALTPREFEFLLFLLRNPGRPWTRAQLLDRVWGPEFQGDGRTVDIHVRRLRSKIEEQPGRPRRLLTEWGVGYRLVDDAS